MIDTYLFFQSSQHSSQAKINYHYSYWAPKRAYNLGQAWSEEWSGVKIQIQGIPLCHMFAVSSYSEIY